MKRKTKYLFILFTLFCNCNHSKEKSVINDSDYKKVIYNLKINQKKMRPLPLEDTTKLQFWDTSISDVVMFDSNEYKQMKEEMDSIKELIEKNSKLDTKKMTKEID